MERWIIEEAQTHSFRGIEKIEKTKSGVRWVMGSYVMGDNNYLKWVVGALSVAIMVSVSQILLGSADSQVMN